MPPGNPRVVLDTNVLLRGFLNAQSAAGRVLNACSQRAIIVVLSRDVLAEYRSILTAPFIVERYPELTPRTVELMLRRLRYVGDVIDTSTIHFDFLRDPKDEKIIELNNRARFVYL